MSGHFFLVAAIPRQKGKSSLREAGLTRRVLSLTMSWVSGLRKTQRPRTKRSMMRQIILSAALVWSLGVTACALAQDKAASAAQGDGAAAAPAVKKLTIEVIGGETNVAVENASVYLKYVEEKKLRKDKKYALNVKTNRDGTAHIPDPPLGKVLIQVVADGWKTYGQYYVLNDSGTVIKIHLDRPTKWY
jgi:hypothetical protein